MVKNVHGHTLDLLGQAILSGRYAVGASLPPEPVLCEELGVSRTVVREAIKSLVAKGLISTGPKVGTRVLTDEQWNWFDPDVITWQAQAGLTRNVYVYYIIARNTVDEDMLESHQSKRSIQDILMENLKRRAA